jgi:REP element-mobilizing transposase RayT
MATPKAAFQQQDLRDPLPSNSPEHARWSAVLDPVRAHGGPASNGKRKGKRPFFPGTPLVAILSSRRARGAWNLAHRRNRSRITAQAYSYAVRFRVRILTFRIVAGQIQLLVKAKERKDLADFFRVLAGRVAITVTGARKQVRKTGKFWDELCFTRMLNWGTEFHEMRNALFQGPPFRVVLASSGSTLEPLGRGS